MLNVGVDFRCQGDPYSSHYLPLSRGAVDGGCQTSEQKGSTSRNTLES